MRSLLFVPGDSERKLAKSLVSGADAIIVDLEDSVAAANKAGARAIATRFIADLPRERATKICVRVNELGSGAFQLRLPAGRFTAECTAPTQKSIAFFSLAQPTTLNIDCS